MYENRLNWAWSQVNDTHADDSDRNGVDIGKVNLGDKVLQCRMSTGLQPANLDLSDTRNKESYQEEDVTSIDHFTRVDRGFELGSSSPFKRHATTLSSTYAPVLCISSFGTASRFPLVGLHVSGPHWHAWRFHIALHWVLFFLRLMLRAQDAEFCFEPWFVSTVWLYIHTYIHTLLARPHGAFQSQFYITKL